MISPARIFTTVRYGIRTIATYGWRIRRAGRRQRWPAAWCRSRSDPTPTARSACLPRSAACSGSNRPTEGSVARALFRVGKLRSRRPAGAQCPRPGASLRCHAGLRLRTIQFAPIALRSRLLRFWTEGDGRAAHRCRRRVFQVPDRGIGLRRRPRSGRARRQSRHR